MAGYPYSTELPAPGNWTSVDFSNPKLAPAVHMMVTGIQNEVASYQPDAGVMLHRESVATWDGNTINCYVFEPESGKEQLGAILYCHGGGFFLPIQPMMMRLAEQYARELQVRVFLPEYRILPKYRSPYPFRDCLSVWKNIQEDSRVDKEQMLLYGESAGGALATGIALWTRDEGRKAAQGQLLIYPVLDNRCSRYTSVRLYSEAAWPLKNNLAMWREYLKDGMQESEAYIVPMHSEDLSHLPQAYIEPMGIDILRDEGITYGERLVEAGVPCDVNVIEGAYHGYDAAVDNDFVQSVVHKRIDVMRKYLA